MSKVLISTVFDIRFYSPKIFRFEACWLKELDVDDVVHRKCRGIQGSKNISGAWVDNLRRLHAAFEKMVNIKNPVQQTIEREATP